MLSNRFLLTANIEASDGGAAIVRGNERVVRARLADARFFWESDLAALPDYAASGLEPLDQRAKKLADLGIVFHEKLGTQAERVERIAALARELAPVVGADPALAERAARLCKADLVTEMVGEFPELQGLMGRYYAAAQGEDPAVAAAIEEHYCPLGPSDRVPTAPVSVAVALADKLDTLVGFWAIDEKPTGSKDPYALRRAALGVIRLVLENGLRLPLRRLTIYGRTATGEPFVAPATGSFGYTELFSNLLAFFHDRLKVYLRDRGARHVLIDAVLAAGTPPRHAEEPPGHGPGASRSTHDGDASFETPAARAPQDDERGSGGAGNDDLLAIVRRVEALGRLLATDDGRNLLAGAKRALNILRIEEKKDGRRFDAAPDPALLVLPEERALAGALDVAAREAAAFVAAEDYEGAMRALAGLRPAVDAFFDAVTVNDADPARRENRLNLLGRLRAATGTVADMSLVEG